MRCVEGEGLGPALLGNHCPVDWNATGQEKFAEGLVHEILKTWHVFCKRGGLCYSPFHLCRMCFTAEVLNSKYTVRKNFCISVYELK